MDDREKKAIELVATAAGGLHEVKRVAKEAAHEKLRESASRARATSKTPKSAQTRKRIIDAASELMRERGSMDFQMSEVSDRCHMSKGSIYYYFSDKDALTSAIFAETFESFLGELQEAADAAPDAISALREIGYRFAEACGDSAPFAVALATEAVTPIQTTGRPYVASLVKLVGDQLERGKREGLVRETADTQTFAMFAVGGSLLTGLVIPADQCGQKIKDAIDVLIEHAVHGIGVQEAPAAPMT